MFEKMSNILEEKETENFKLEKFKVEFPYRNVPVGEYIRLVDKNKGFSKVIMSDTPMEWNTNSTIINKANGDILIGGLGIGLILIPLLKNKDVKSILVIEKNQEIIDIILPQLKKLPNSNKLNIIKDDVFKISFKDNECFDVIYMDIWNYINSDVYKEMVALKRKYKKYLKKDNLNTWIGCWCEREAKNNSRI